MIRITGDWLKNIRSLDLHEHNFLNKRLFSIPLQKDTLIGAYFAHLLQADELINFSESRNYLDCMNYRVRVMK